MKLLQVAVATVWSFLCISQAMAQQYVVSREGLFAPQRKSVLLLKDQTTLKKVILFKAGLAVNTDGSPLSYHPDDLMGTTKALNNICNAIAVRKGTSKRNLCLSRQRQEVREAIGVFERFRETNFQSVPAGYQIIWHNVLASKEMNGKPAPCIFSSGEFSGYFGSITALTNALTGDKGECDINNQVNPLSVPALVIPGGSNIVAKFGARLGDLLIAYNPRNERFGTAIVGDIGPADKLGEGSIALNKSLLGSTSTPSRRKDTYALAINDQVLIAIIPNSRLFQPMRPYTAENIAQRVQSWLEEAGFDGLQSFIDYVKTFQSKLR